MNPGTCDTSEEIAKFFYDGDGKRVKSVVGSETTLFIGAHYEVTDPGSGQTVTKYYFAGMQRIAMRKYIIPSSMAVEYLLGDHLGSTSLTTDANGAKVSEIRYGAWGEIRYSWTSGVAATPDYKLSSYTFTGQYSHMDDPTTQPEEGFGLMFYNARWYDPYLNHFTQPDSIVPDPNNPQAWDRYAYTNNNPMRYTDPTGHRLVENEGGGGDGGCGLQCLKTRKEEEKARQAAKEWGAWFNSCIKGKTFATCNGGFVGELGSFLPNPAEFSYTNYSSSEDFLLAGYRYEINWSQVDWYHFVTNGAGLVSDGAAILTIVGIFPAAPAFEVGLVIDVLGVTTDVFDYVENNDITGVNLDVAQLVLGESKAGRIIPLLGFGQNWDGFLDALYRGRTKTPVWIPKP